MKRLSLLIPAIAAAVMLYTVPALSDEGTMYGTEGASAVTKDECLLVAMNCVDNVDSIQQRIERLHKEIARGADVYTTDELRILNKKLDEANKLFEEIVSGG